MTPIAGFTMLPPADDLWSSLGNTASNTYPVEATSGESDDARAAFKRAQYRLQRVAGDILGSDGGVAFCMTRPTGGAVSVERVHHDDGCGRSHFSGLMTCSSIWTCPVCAAKVAAQRADEIKDVVASAISLGYVPVLITYTIQHHRGQPLKNLLEDLKQGLVYMRSGAAHKRFRERFGVLGYIRATEIRYGLENGWHPHSHELLFVEADTLDVDGIRQAVYDRYGKWLDDHGYLVNEATVDVRTNENSEAIVSEYLTKTSVELELTGNETKVSGSLSPFQLLSEYDRTGDKVYSALFEEYAVATKNKKMHTWARNLRKLAEFEEDEDEEETSSSDENDVEVMAVLTRDQWWRVVKKHLRADLLIVADQGDRYLLVQWMVMSGIVLEGEVDTLIRRTNRNPGVSLRDE